MPEDPLHLADYTINLNLTKEDISMKKKLSVSVLVLCLIIIIYLLRWAGIGSYSSSSAVQDLKAELKTIYGTEYTGKAAENGTEDMVFEVAPKTWFLTNWNLRNALSLDYQYECKVIFTTYVDGTPESTRTITYQAVDPMGAEESGQSAFLDLDSKTEITEDK